MSNLSQFLIGNRQNSQAFTSSGTWTAPSGVSVATVLLVGGGGSGASSTNSISYSNIGRSEEHTSELQSH